MLKFSKINLTLLKTPKGICAIDFKELPIHSKLFQNEFDRFLSIPQLIH